MDDCTQCQSACGEVEPWGLMSNSIEVRHGADRYQLRWRCPGCQIQVHEQAGLLALEATSQTVEADPLCVKCRNSAVGKPANP